MGVLLPPLETVFLLLVKFAQPRYEVLPSLSCLVLSRLAVVSQRTALF